MSRPDVSVVVPTWQGAAHLGAALRSLARQTLSRERYEVVVVPNGPDDGTAELLRSTRHAYPELVLRTVTTATPGVGLARNLGLAAARGRYVVFVDDDDTVSAEYLEVLLAHSGPRTVGLAQMADVPAEGGPPDFVGSGSTRWQLRLRDEVVPVSALPGAFGYTAAKMLPTELARRVGFDESLRSGEDVAFWAQVLATGDLDLGLCPASEHAVYFRTLRAHSVSRQQTSYDFNVSQRLDVLTRLDEVLASPQSADVERVVRALQAGQVGFINRFLREHPDRHADTILEIRERGLSTIPYEQVNKGVARDLAVLYVALPYSDTSALVAARRIRHRQTLVDVVTSDMSTVFDRDETAQRIWREFVGEVAETPTRPCNAWWPGVLDYSRKGMRQIEAWEAEKGPYRSVYSRTMWPAAHVLAAWYKIRNPEAHWLAEFSDPVLHGLHGQVRVGHGVPDEPFMAEVRTALAAAGWRVPEDQNLHLWVETLAYAFADTILFTNEHQRSYMLGYCEDEALVARVLEHSVVEPQPSLPPEFYSIVPSSYPIDPGLVNVAYFGVLLATRGLTEVFAALRALSTEHRGRLRLHVFTPKPEELEAQAREAGLEHTLVANPYVSYLEFLNLTTRFDVLLVNDARTADSHSINPYMPSKWSDYAGSGQPVWGIVEPGSQLSTRPLAYTSELGDVEGARRVLESLVSDDRAAARELAPS